MTYCFSLKVTSRVPKFSLPLILVKSRGSISPGPSADIEDGENRLSKTAFLSARVELPRSSSNLSSLREAENTMALETTCLIIPQLLQTEEEASRYSLHKRYIRNNIKLIIYQ